jgi:hypothetical protein
MIGRECKNMTNNIICSIKEGKEKIGHLKSDDVILLTIFNEDKFIHSENQKINREKGEKLIDKAEKIEYQDNDFFGRLSLFGVRKSKLVYNLLFQQKNEQIIEHPF